MLTKTDDDSSSSEDEISKDALKEAADHEFLKDTYFSVKNNNSSEKKEHTVKPSITKDKNTEILGLKSLRKQQEEGDQFLNLGVTPSFQNFVAKKLDELIERNIKLKKKHENDGIRHEKKEHEDNNIGIKLLRSSTCLLTTEQDVEEPIKYKKRKKQDETLNESLNNLMCKEVAVEPDWVFSKSGTKGWTPKRKDLEFKYKKLKNGLLVEKE